MIKNEGDSSRFVNKWKDQREIKGIERGLQYCDSGFVQR